MKNKVNLFIQNGLAFCFENKFHFLLKLLSGKVILKSYFFRNNRKNIRVILTFMAILIIKSSNSE